MKARAARTAPQGRPEIIKAVALEGPTARGITDSANDLPVPVPGKFEAGALLSFKRGSVSLLGVSRNAGVDDRSHRSLRQVWFP